MARPHPALLEVAAGRPVPSVDDLGGLVRSALEHRMAGLVFSYVEAGRLPASGHWLHALARQDLLERSRQLRLWGILEEATLRLRSAGFEVATAKGLTAQARWYDRAGERPCVDVDLLIAPGDVARIEHLVRVLDPHHHLLPKVQSLVDCGFLQWIDVQARPGLWLDLHPDLFKLGLPSRRLDLIWGRTRPFRLPSGQTVRVPDPEISLIHFLVHVNKDRFPYLLGLVDVHRILEREELDWEFIDRFLHEEGLETPVRLALDTVVETLRISHPYRRAVGGWRAVAWRRLWPASSLVQGRQGTTQRPHREFFLPFLIRGRFPAALRWWLRRLFPPAPLVDRWYGSGRSPYLWRLVSGRIRRLWLRPNANSDRR